MTAADDNQRPEDRQQEHPDDVDALQPGMRGRWLISTVRSRHVWDLDAGTYQRMPGEGGKTFDFDGRPVVIGRVGRWPEVGRSFLIFFDDPDRPWMEQWRLSSPVQSIRRLWPR